jgi:hypothetical protein
MIQRKDQTSIATNGEIGDDPGARQSPGVRPVPAPSSLMGAAVSLAASMATFAASGFKTVDQPLHDLRMSHCGACEYRHETQCSLCRCFIAKKAWLPHEDCPIGKWPT